MGKYQSNDDNNLLVTVNISRGDERAGVTPVVTNTNVRVHLIRPIKFMDFADQLLIGNASLRSWKFVPAGDGRIVFLSTPGTR